MKIIRVSILILGILSCVSALFAQRVNSPSITTGYTPAGASLDPYPLHGFANINEFNGALNFSLPLSAVKGRGDTSIPLIFYNEADSISVKHLDFTRPGDSGYIYHQYGIGVDKYTQVKKAVINLGMIVARRSGDLYYVVSVVGAPPAPATNYQRKCQTLSRVTFIAPDGSEVELRDRATNGAVHGNNYNLLDGTPPLNRGRIFDSKDGSSMTFISDTDVVDPTCPDLTGTIFPDYLSGTLYLSNGSVYRFDNGKITSILDRNGNKSIIEYTVSSANYPMTKITSSIGHQVTVEYRDELVTLSEKGVGGRDKITKIHRGPAQLRSDHQLKNYSQLFPAVTGSGSFSDGTYYPGSRVNSVELPNGKTYQLYYNSYGELARVELPSGGAYEYDYSAQFGTYNGRSGDAALTGETTLSSNGNTSWGADWAITRRVVKHRVYNSGNTLETETFYAAGSAVVTGAPTSIIDVQTRNADNILLSHSKAHFHGAAINSYSSGRLVTSYNLPFEGREFKRETFDVSGNLHRVIENTWEQTAVPHQPENERIKETKTILSDANLVTKKSFEYDSYNNVKDVYEYDYGTGSPGSFIRRTHTEYLTGSNYINNSGVRMTALPIQSWVSSDINGANKASFSQTEYDNYSSNPGHFPLTPRSNVIGFDAVNFGVSYTYRGNPTSTITYGNAQNQTESIATFSQYDVLGNIIKTIDAKGHQSTIGYEDNFGAPNGEARTNIIPTELQANSQHPVLNTFAFPTTATNALNWITGYSQVDYYTGQPVDVEDLNGLVDSTFYNDALDRPTQKIKANNLPDFRRQKTILYDDDEDRRVETKSDLNAFNDKLIKSESFYDGLGRTIKTHEYESDGNFIVTLSVPFVTVQDPETGIWRAGTKASNPYRPHLNEQPVWATNLLDSLDRNIKVITPDGAIAKTEYSGNSVTVTDQAGKKRRSVTNAVGMLTEVHEPNNAGQLDENGVPAQKTVYSYDPLNNLVQVQQIGSNAEQCGGTATSCTQNRSFVYDSLSRLKSENNPESGLIQYTYDNNGNLLTKTNARNITTTYTYDALNRVTIRNYSDSTPDVIYTYDNLPNAKGKLTKVLNGLSSNGVIANPFSITEYQQFDSVGRITQSQQTTDGAAYPAMTYTYNLAGALIEQKYPSGRVVKNVLDNTGEISIVLSKKNETAGFWNYADNFTYTAAGMLSSMQFGNGRWESRQYNSRLQPTQIALGTIQNGTDKLKLNFDYGTLNTGNGQVIAGTNNDTIGKQTITVPTEVRGGTTYNGFTATQYYIYDSLNRIKLANENITPLNQPAYQSWGQAFNYDRYGNRTFDEGKIGNQFLTTTLPRMCGTTEEPTLCANDKKIFNPQAQTSDNKFGSTDSYQYDAAGNMTKDAQSRKFTYDAENKQIKVETIDSGGNVIGTLGEYFYDGDGKRVKKYVPGTGETTVFIYDASGKMVAENSTLPSPTQKVSYLTSDHLGSPRINTDTNGNVTARHDYQPFGEEIVRASYGADTNRKKFTSHERDSEIGLDYMQTRYFASHHGRFTSPDSLSPIELEGDEFLNYVCQPQNLNRYAYVTNNPLHQYDSDGRIAVPAAAVAVVKVVVVRAVGGAIVGAVVNAAIEGGKQVILDGKINETKIKAAAVNGAVAGAIIGGTGGLGLLASKPRQIVITAAAETLGGIVERYLDEDSTTEPVNLTDAVIDGGSGVFGSITGDAMKNRLGSKTTQKWIKFYKYRQKTTKNPKQFYRAQVELNFLNTWEAGEKFLLSDFGGELGETLMKDASKGTLDQWNTYVEDVRLEEPNAPR